MKKFTSTWKKERTTPRTEKVMENSTKNLERTIARDPLCGLKIKLWPIFVLHEYRIIATGFLLHTCVAILKIQNSDLFSPRLMSTLIYFLLRVAIQTYSRLLVIFCQLSVSSSKGVFSFKLSLV